MKEIIEQAIATIQANDMILRFQQIILLQMLFMTHYQHQRGVYALLFLLPLIMMKERESIVLKRYQIPMILPEKLVTAQPNQVILTETSPKP